MARNYGMATMTHRTTFARDSDTMRRLKKLASRWQVSQAEVVRRALSQAEARPDVQQPDALARLKKYHAASTLDVSRADAYLAQARADRWRWSLGSENDCFVTGQKKQGGFAAPIRSS